MTLDSTFIRSVMRWWSSGVTIVTSASGEQRHGMTVSSFTTVSLEPPQILISLANSSKTQQLITASGCFAVTILSAGQQAEAQCFAGQTCEDDERFAGLATFTLQSGAPLLTGGLAFFDCRVAASYPAGANTLFLGELLALREGDPGAPLLYFNRDYRQLA